MNISSISNFSSNIVNSSDESLYELLDRLGFQPWQTITNQFVLPVINLVGIATCSMSAWIFFKRQFDDPVFFYYRMLTLFYIFFLTVNIPANFCFSPQFWFSTKLTNTFFCAVYNVYYGTFTFFLFQFCSVIEICILLARMRIFSSSIKKCFSLSHKKIFLILFLVCFVIDFPLWFAVNVGSLGEFYFIDSERHKINYTLYYYISSQFSLTPLGQLFFATSYFLNIVITLFAGIFLSILSVLQYKSYLKKRRQGAEDTQLRSRKNQPHNSSAVSADPRLTQKERIEQKTENNMFYMALTLSLISVTSKTVYMFSFIYSAFFNSLANLKLANLIIFVTLDNVVFALVPLTSILVFYFFNKMFRQQFQNTFGLRRETNSNQTDQHSQTTTQL